MSFPQDKIQMIDNFLGTKKNNKQFNKMLGIRGFQICQTFYLAINKSQQKYQNSYKLEGVGLVHNRPSNN